MVELGAVELGHGLFGQVAPFGDGPLVVGLDDDPVTRSATLASLRKIPTTLVRRLISPLTRSIAGWWTRSCATGGGKAVKATRRQ
jgi:hypothetical protein